MIARPSVTQAIGFCNSRAYEMIPPHLLEAAKERGTTFHELTAAYAQKLWINEIPDDLQGRFKSFRRWFDRHVEEVIAVERRLHHPTWHYEGTPDLIARLFGDSTFTVVDYKTPVAVQKAWRLQLAGYKELAENSFHIDVGRVASLQPHTTGREAKFVEYKTTVNDLQVFLASVAVWRFFNE